MWFPAGGAEELSWECATEFDAMGAVSTKYNETLRESFTRAYDAHQRRFVIAVAVR